MKAFIDRLKLKKFRMWAFAFGAIAIAFVLGGCAEGYGGAYYAPDYGTYYGSYGYGGGPYYYGYDPGYYGGYSIGGNRHYRYYGGHHFAHDFGGRGTHAAPAGHVGGAAHVGGGGRGPRG